MLVEAHAFARQPKKIRRIALSDEVGPQPVPYHKHHDSPAPAMRGNGILRESSVIKLVPDQSVLKLNFGDPIRITAAEFKDLSAAFLHELERKFL